MTSITSSIQLRVKLPLFLLANSLCPEHPEGASGIESSLERRVAQFFFRPIPSQRKTRPMERGASRGCRSISIAHPKRGRRPRAGPVGQATEHLASQYTPAFVLIFGDSSRVLSILGRVLIRWMKGTPPVAISGLIHAESSREWDGVGALESLNADEWLIKAGWMGAWERRGRENHFLLHLLQKKLCCR